LKQSTVAEEREVGERKKKKKKGPCGERRSILPNQSSHWERGWEITSCEIPLFTLQQAIGCKSLDLQRLNLLLLQVKTTLRFKYLKLRH
jgi:hypothetical protein